MTKNEVAVIVPLERDGGYVEILDVCEEAYGIERAENMQLLRRNDMALPGDKKDKALRYSSALLALMARDTSKGFGMPANSPGAPKWRIYEKGRPQEVRQWRLYGFYISLFNQLSGHHQDTHIQIG